MSRIRVSAAALMALAAAACSDAPSAPEATLTPRPISQQVQDDVVPGEILVQMKQGIDMAVLTPSNGGVRFSRTLAGGRLGVLSVTRGAERAEAARIAADPRVEWAEPNYLRHPTAINPKLWAFYNPGSLRASFNDGTGFLPTTYSSILDADQDVLEGIGAGGAPVVIGSLDTGVDTDHPELAGRIILGKDWVNNDNLPEDDDGHGTHTAGTMIGTTVGVAGVTGAGTNVKLHVQKVCGPSGCPVSAIVNAIYAAADYPGMVAMNLSLGGTTESTAEKNAITYATNKNVLVIVAAGNSGTSKLGCPACDANSVAVSATSWRDGLAYYSQYGKGLDISAGGGELYSNTTDEMGIYSSFLNGGYAYLQGTSMATPQVTGTAGVVASKTGLRGTALRNRLQSTADDIGTAGYDTKFGNGRLNVYRAITGTSLGAGL
ncbi:S8 family serine peptidase [Longimicrobium sp.]|uniref:S8 family serine peptidase n=1 Tax=Longimicrobium sp. TaxID=2029185 RepID=UPI002E2F4149|nr:S8 family serine peptidase [Longimicrobium sp.]HEX6038939.1 S8 family serine peptidase [Longimicrobium sp.]